VNTLLCRAVCAWAGVPLPEHDVARRTRQFAAMIAAAGVAGPPHWAGRLARNRAEAWIRGLIRDIRRGAVTVPPDSAAAVIAGHRKLNGDLLDAQVAAVELINVLRPTVAIGRFITFAALALYAHPAAREQVEAGDAGAVDRFVQEVRRYYPFFPFVPACVRHTFTWHGYRFPRGRRVVLDLYGTDHHPRLWDAPERFQPERFRARPVTPYDFIPQGGDGYNPGHRCPGEPITVALMAQAVDRLVHGLTYTVPPQDLRVSLSRMPTKPHSGFVIRDVRRVGAPAA